MSEVAALRLTADEWLHELYPTITTSEAQEGALRGRVERLQWQLAVRALELDCNVVLDWGVWAREERDLYRSGRLTRASPRRVSCGRSSRAKEACAMFFRTKDGRAYPVSRIRAIHPPRPDAISVSLEGGEVVESWPSDVAELARRPALAFAAHEGAYVLRFDGASTSGEVGKTAIIGWCVGMDGKTYPVTVNGVNDGVAEALSVLTADGKVSRPDAELWDSIDACITSLRAALKAA